MKIMKISSVKSMMTKRLRNRPFTSVKKDIQAKARKIRIRLMLKLINLNMSSQDQVSQKRKLRRTTMKLRTYFNFFGKF